MGDLFPHLPFFIKVRYPLMNEFISGQAFNNVKNFSNGLETPFLILNLNIVKDRYETIKKGMPSASIYYAVKTNSSKEVLETLRDLGSSFDVASVYELRELLSLGIDPVKISYGNTVKKSAHIKEFYESGVRLFVTDNEDDLKKIAQNAPNAKVFFRILMDGEGAEVPLNKKFGAHPDAIYKLVLKAKNLNLEPYGLSFHVGSQQRDIQQWDKAISICKYLFDSCREDHDVQLKLINLGGGLPSNYLNKTHPLERYLEEINNFINDNFEGEIPEIIMEPGRAIVGDAGILVTEVVAVSRRSTTDLNRWVYTDAGLYNGLFEALGECIKYPLVAEKDGPNSEVILAGPTCDSLDTLYQDFKYSLPNNITEGDRLYFINAGAYSLNLSAANFNGIPPLEYYIIKD
jgi:ornithine decarboxylase